VLCEVNATYSLHTHSAALYPPLSNSVKMVGVDNSSVRAEVLHKSVGLVASAAEGRCNKPRELSQLTAS